MERGSGLLVHISELPSSYGIGTFGKDARNFVRFLNESKQKYWQILPLNPTSFGDSPYQSFSAFALNPYFIDLDILIKKGYLTKKDVRPYKKDEDPTKVNYGKLFEERYFILRKAYNNAKTLIDENLLKKFIRRHKSWIDDFALFMTIKDLFDGVSWMEWPRDYRLHKRSKLNEVRESYHDNYLFHIWLQYEAFEQYYKLKRYANSKGVKIIGDMPIYVALDSADVWGNPKLYQLDKNHNPTGVAGVPPDCFSSTGQLWGNPLYDYDYMEKNGFRWWKLRFKKMGQLYDLLRVDHFRGFDSYWSIPYGYENAINGKWVEGPGYKLFESCEKEISKIQIIAEDLGIINDSVRELKAKCNFPGLKIYQFAFDDYEAHKRHDFSIEYLDRFKDRLTKEYYDDEERRLAFLLNAYLPHNYEKNCVAYIGTHDNDIQDNFLNEHPHLLPFMKEYLRIDRDEDIHDTLIGSLMRSNADVVIFMPQDILRLGKESRINIPGNPFNNWRFRFKKEQFSKDFKEHLKVMTEEAGRD